LIFKIAKSCKKQSLYKDFARGPRKRNKALARVRTNRKLAPKGLGKQDAESCNLIMLLVGRSFEDSATETMEEDEPTGPPSISHHFAHCLNHRILHLASSHAPPILLPEA